MADEFRKTNQRFNKAEDYQKDLCRLVLSKVRCNQILPFTHPEVLITSGIADFLGFSTSPRQ